MKFIRFNAIMIILLSITCWAQALSPIDAQFSAGLLAYQEKDYDQALQRLAYVCNAEPANNKARFFLSWSLIMSNKPDKALPHAQFLASKEPQNPDFKVLLQAADTRFRESSKPAPVVQSEPENFCPEWVATIVEVSKKSLDEKTHCENLLQLSNALQANPVFQFIANKIALEGLAFFEKNPSSDLSSIMLRKFHANAWKQPMMKEPLYEVTKQFYQMAIRDKAFAKKYSHLASDIAESLIEGGFSEKLEKLFSAFNSPTALKIANFISLLKQNKSQEALEMANSIDFTKAGDSKKLSIFMKLVKKKFLKEAELFLATAFAKDNENLELVLLEAASESDLSQIDAGLHESKIKTSKGKIRVLCLKANKCTKLGKKNEALAILDEARILAKAGIENNAYNFLSQAYLMAADLNMATKMLEKVDVKNRVWVLIAWGAPIAKEKDRAALKVLLQNLQPLFLLEKTTVLAELFAQMDAKTFLEMKDTLFSGCTEDLKLNFLQKSALSYAEMGMTGEALESFKAILPLIKDDSLEIQTKVIAEILSANACQEMSAFPEIPVLLQTYLNRSPEIKKKELADDLREKTLHPEVRKRIEATIKSVCHSYSRIITSATEMYNMDKDGDQRLTTLKHEDVIANGLLVNAHYLGSPIAPPSKNCHYVSNGDLTTDDGKITCSVHGGYEND